MPYRNSLVVIALLLFVGAGCSTKLNTESIPIETQPANEVAAVYTSESWKEMIAPSCQSFFDGCNNCRRTEGSELAACTKMACSVYEQPECNDILEEGTLLVEPSLAIITDFSTLATFDTDREVVLLGTYQDGDIVDDAGVVVALQIQENTAFPDYPLELLSERKRDFMVENGETIVHLAMLATIEGGYVSDGDSIRIVGTYMQSLDYIPRDPVRGGVIVKTFERVSGTIAIPIPVIEPTDAVVALPVPEVSRTIVVGDMISLEIPVHCLDNERSGTTYVACPTPENETPLPEFTIHIEGTQVTMRRWEGLYSPIWDAAVASLRIVAPLQLGVQIDIDQ